MATHGYGWKPSPPDVRDYKLRFYGAEYAPEVDLRTTGFLPEIWDQGQLGSCTAHGAGAAYSFDLEKQFTSDNFDPSRLFIYYTTREIEGTVDQDSGAYIRDAIKSLNQYGAPPSTDWAYDISRFTEKPPQQAYDNGKLREAVKYAAVSQNAAEMKACLTAGYPIVIGFTVYDSFESAEVASTGDVPMPSLNEKVAGGHCVLIVGYTVRNGNPVWIARNSWGTGWGDQGYFYFPEAYLLNSDLADDFWVVQSVSSPDPAPAPPGPVPPDPTPVPDPADPDRALFDATYTWSYQRHVRCNKVAALAVRDWAAQKGLTK
jgi:C1A family cysteine protease